MNNFFPAPYDVQNAYNASMNPSAVHIKNTALAHYFKRYLLQEAISVFDWKLPKFWDRGYFFYVLYIMGYIGIMKTDAYGVIPQHGTLGGRNIFYAPKYLLVANPLFDRSYRLEINRDCAILKLQPDFCGLYDIVDYYGDLMALTAETAGVNLINSKLSFVFAATNSKIADSYKELYDQIASGTPAAFADKKLFDDQGNLNVTMFNQDVGGNFITPQLLDCLKTIRCMFLTDIGIPNANIVKQSGIGPDEVNANNFETRAKCTLWLDQLKLCIERAIEMYPELDGKLAVDWRVDIPLKGVNDERLPAVDPYAV